jgi:hypothetical protein
VSVCPWCLFAWAILVPPQAMDGACYCPLVRNGWLVSWVGLVSRVGWLVGLGLEVGWLVGQGLDLARWSERVEDSFAFGLLSAWVAVVLLLLLYSE